MLLIASLAAPFVFFYAYLYLKVAAQVRRKHNVRAYPYFEPCHRDSLPPDVRRGFSSEVKGLERSGFAFVAYLRSVSWLPDVDCSSGVYMALLRNEATGDLASVTEIVTRVKRVGKRRRFVAFTAELTGGESVTTANTQSVGVFKPDPHRPVFKFPEIGDARFLHRVHRALVERGARGRRGVLPTPGMEVPYLCEVESMALRRQVECGYFYLDESRRQYVHTWKGALVMTGKVMYGVKNLLVARQRARARETLKLLGLKTA